MTMAFKPLAMALVCAGLLGISGCGGGGGASTNATSSMLSGTIAGGAAVVGTVLVTDSLGATKGSTIEANGHYTVDVAGMTGPFMLKASGTVGSTSVTYYSAATSADVNGTVNVTPFTNLMVSNIAAQLAENYFATNQSANFATLFTPEKLAAAQTALLAKLQPVLAALGVSDSINLLRGTFAADHSGMDAVLDMVKVETNTTTNIVTLKNALTNIAIATDDTATSTDNATAADSSKLSGITTAAVTDLQAIVTKLNAFAALFATGLPQSGTAIADSGVFDTTSAFMMGGKTFAQFQTEVSTDATVVGMKFSNVAIALDPGATSTTGTATLTAALSFNDVASNTNIHLKMVKTGGVWKSIGNGRIAETSSTAQATWSHWRNGANSGDNTAISGISFHINPTAYNANNVNDKVATALITGPGLGSGVTLESAGPTEWMRLPSYPSNFNTNTVPECGRTIQGVNGGNAFTTQCVTIADAVDNSEYTVTLKKSDGTVINTGGYKQILAKQPLLSTTLVASPATYFPNITSITIDGVNGLTPSALVNGKAVVVAWTMPSGQSPAWLSAWATDVSNLSYFKVNKQLLAAATSGLFSVSTTGAGATTPTEANVWLESKDTFGRRYGTGLYVN